MLQKRFAAAFRTFSVQMSRGLGEHGCQEAYHIFATPHFSYPMSAILLSTSETSENIS